MKTIVLSKSPFSKLMGRSGFTLIEMAVVMVIVGIIISIMATVLPSLIHSGKIKKAQADLERADLALQGYISATGRCPCPDTNADGEENRNDGGTQGNPADDTCAAYVGDLPYLTLGLSS
ncbi:MAG: prepilin-type N-terminal cleavage/methylation domain-containing protein, partial [Deltaproteobacteria bacterium]|nr:prepilin-type N-terminal cleavage/methylation domain-containing protein [Deltaproteobacteria bacterium]NNK84768.1 prepilin-type N-terminal cleavage/methylation domain-containing protein [Desulfobacterales bacterium]